MKKAALIIGKILLWITGILLLLLISTILLLRLPSVQTFVTQKAIKFVTDKTNTKVELKKLYIAFPKSVVIEGLYAEDLNKDTLIYLQELKVDIGMWGLLKNKIDVNSLSVKGLTGNVIRTLPDSAFNFDFFIQAFAGDPTKKEVKEDTTSSKPMQISVGNVKLEDINAEYLDEVSGMELSLILGSLSLDMDEMDLTSMKFHIDKIALANTNVKFIQTKNTQSTDTTTSALPDIDLKKLELSNVKAFYENRPSGQKFLINSETLDLKTDKVNLLTQQIDIDELKINKTNIIIEMRKEETTAQSEPVTSETNSQGWAVNANSIGLENVNFKYDISDIPRAKEGMDYNHLYFSNVNIDLKNTKYSDALTATDVKNISLNEQSGLQLRKLTAKVEFDDQHAELKDLLLITPHTRISDYIGITYPSIESLSDSLGNMVVDVRLKKADIGLNDVLIFAPDLKSQPPFAGKKGKVIRLDGTIEGAVKDLYVNNFSISTESTTQINFNAHLQGLPNAEKAYYDLKLEKFQTSHKDIKVLVPAKMIPAAVQIPEIISLTGNFKGSMKDFNSKMNLNTSSGDAEFDVVMKDVKGQPAYKLNMSTHNMDLGYILKDPKMYGPVTMSAKVNGVGFDPEKIKADVKAEISAARFNLYNYTGIKIDAEIIGQQYKADLTINDPNLILTLNADVLMKDTLQKYLVRMDLTGADLYALNLSKEKVRTSGFMNIDMHGKSAETLNGNLDLSNIVILKKEERYKIDSFLIASVNEDNYSALKIKSAMFNLEYEGSLAVAKLSDAITNHVDQYFDITKENVAKKDTSAQSFKLGLKIVPHPIFNEVLFPQLTEFDGADLNVEFDNREPKMLVKMDVPVVKFGDNRITDLKVDINSNETSINYDVNFTKLNSGSIKLPLTRLSGGLQNDSVTFNVKISEENKEKLNIAGNVVKDQEAFILHLDEENLVFNDQRWLLPEENFIRFEPNGFYVNELVLVNNTQLLSVRSQANEVNAPIEIKFNSFELGTLSQIVEDDTAIVRGLINGEVELKNLQAAPSFVSDIKIDNIVFKNTSVGNIEVKADNLSANRYTATLLLTGNDNDAKIDGYYSTEANTNALNFNADINKINIASVESFTGGQIRRSTGYVTGDIKISGTADKPVINGTIGFKEAGFNVAYINNYIRLNDEKIRISPEGIFFDSFNLKDSLGNPASISGAVYTSDFSKMKFDLEVEMNKFKVLNTTGRDNPLYYGNIILDSYIKVTGTESLPVVNANLKLIRGSAMTVVVPSSEIVIDNGDGVVLFIDTSVNPIMNRTDSIDTQIDIKGIDLNANIEIDRETSFKVIVDKSSGDSLVAKGTGTLSFSLDPSGKQSLSGRYDLNSGSYRASFKKVVKREFDIKPGSSLIWSGDPLDAMVDITAIYTTKTSPADLLASEISQTNSEERNVYRKPLTFYVDLIIKGKLLKPEISFALDMPENQRDAFGGSVYSKLNSLNTDPNELNKQVFSLLVLNKFLPTGNSSSGGNAVNTVARNSVNQALSDQLNSLSGKYVKGVELNFDIQSNDDYTATGVEENTEVQVGLKKELFNNRVSVQVGSSVNLQENDPQQANSGSLGGDVIVEYKITEDGRYKFKAFRENQYEGIIDGLLYRTGLGISYTREYNKFKELFSPPKTEKQIEAEEKEKREKQKIRKQEEKLKQEKQNATTVDEEK